MDAGADYLRDRMLMLTIGMAACGGMALVLCSWFFPPKPIPASYADGEYRNTDCGTLRLHNGNLTFGRASIGYVLERRKNDIAVLPPHMIGVRRDDSGCRVVYEADKFPLYLPLVGSDTPSAVRLMEVGTGQAYTFDRSRAGTGIMPH